jgi:hypothetical protein
VPRIRLRFVASVVLVLGVTACGETSSSLSAPEISSRLQQVTASAGGQPVYFLGDKFQKWRLTDVELEHPGYAFFYGTCHLPAFGEGGCSLPMQVQVDPFDVPWDSIVGCSRLSSLHGVPTVNLDSLVLFYGHPLMRIYISGDDADVKRAVAALRPVGGSLSSADFPAPSAADIAGIDSACGAKPGERGRLGP